MGQKMRERQAQIKVEQERRRKRLIIGLTAVAAVVLIVIAYMILSREQHVTINTDSSGNLTMEKSSFNSKLTYVDYGGKTKLLVMKADDGSYRTALNTCEECFSQGNVTYSLKGDHLICSNCQNQIDKASLGTEEWGGCQPVSIPSGYRDDTDSQIIIDYEVLDYADYVLEQWQEDNYEASMGDYQGTEE